MKSSQRGFIIPLLIVITVLAIVGVGYLVYKSKPVSTSAQSTNLVTAPVSNNQIPATPQDDQSQIIATVTAMLEADRSVSTFQDAENAILQYSSQSVVRQFQSTLKTIPSASLAFLQKELVTVNHSEPDPTSLAFTTVINGDVATTTAVLPTTIATSTENYNGKPNSEIITSTFQNSFAVNLQKEDGVWKVSKTTVLSKGIGNQYSPANQ